MSAGNSPVASRHASWSFSCCPRTCAAVHPEISGRCRWHRWCFQGIHSEAAEIKPFGYFGCEAVSKMAELDRIHRGHVVAQTEVDWILTPQANLLIAVVIAFQSFLLGAEVSLELDAQQDGLNMPLRWSIAFEFLDVVLLLVFSVEYALRCHALQMRFVTSFAGIIDLLLLVTGVFSAVVVAIDLASGVSNNLMMAVQSARRLRILRIGRILSIFPALSMLIKGLIGTMVAIMDSMIWLVWCLLWAPWSVVKLWVAKFRLKSSLVRWAAASWSTFNWCWWKHGRTLQKSWCRIIPCGWLLVSSLVWSFKVHHQTKKDFSTKKERYLNPKKGDCSDCSPIWLRVSFWCHSGGLCMSSLFWYWVTSPFSTWSLGWSVMGCWNWHQESLHLRPRSSTWSLKLWGMRSVMFIR